MKYPQKSLTAMLTPMNIEVIDRRLILNINIIQDTDKFKLEVWREPSNGFYYSVNVQTLFDNNVDLRYVTLKNVFPMTQYTVNELVCDALLTIWKYTVTLFNEKENKYNFTDFKIPNNNPEEFTALLLKRILAMHTVINFTFTKIDSENVFIDPRAFQECSFNINQMTEIYEKTKKDWKNGVKYEEPLSNKKKFFNFLNKKNLTK